MERRSDGTGGLPGQRRTASGTGAKRGGSAEAERIGAAPALGRGEGWVQPWVGMEPGSGADPSQEPWSNAGREGSGSGSGAIGGTVGRRSRGNGKQLDPPPPGPGRCGRATAGETGAGRSTLRSGSRQVDGRHGAHGAGGRWTEKAARGMGSRRSGALTDREGARRGAGMIPAMETPIPASDRGRSLAERALPTEASRSGVEPWREEAPLAPLGHTGSGAAAVAATGR